VAAATRRTPFRRRVPMSRASRPGCLQPELPDGAERTSRGFGSNGSSVWSQTGSIKSLRRQTKQHRASLRLMVKSHPWCRSVLPSDGCQPDAGLAESWRWVPTRGSGLDVASSEPGPSPLITAPAGGAGDITGRRCGQVRRRAAWERRFGSSPRPSPAAPRRAVVCRSAEP
jgi:hypothetical protein